jgi:hypothetical protein
MTDIEHVRYLADRLGVARPTVERWFAGTETPPDVMQRMIRGMNVCPCIKFEKPLCGSCWHFGAHQDICRFCGNGSSMGGGKQ